MELQRNNPNLEVMQIPCPGWVKIVEDMDYNSKTSQDLIKANILPLIENEYKNVILGCTHYPYLINNLKKLTDYKINFINPSKSFTKYIAKDLMEKDLLNKQTSKTEKIFYVSANPEKFKIAAKLFYELTNTPLIADI